VAGILTVGYAAVFHVRHDLAAYWNTHHTRLVFQGIPVVIIWSMFLAAALQIHGYGMYFAYSLLKAWKARAAANQPKTPTS
jgi:Jagunal, ER re-organisation during oogenesis